MQSDNDLWTNLYYRLRPLARSWAYRAGVQIWKGQENDVAEDIVQGALLNLVQYTRNCHKNGTVIGSLERLSLVVAKHYFLDLRRREMRFQHFAPSLDMPGEQPVLERLIDPAQEAEEKIYEEEVLAASARTIAAFSRKLRAAILADLANHTSFDAEPTALQRAFLAAGVCLRDHRHAPSPDPVERGRQSALRSLAYKRLAQAHLC